MEDYLDEKYIGFHKTINHQIDHTFYDLSDLAFPIKLDPAKFMKFLKDINEHEGWEEYYMNSSSNCEWSCVYVLMIALEQKFENFNVCVGNYGFWEHYWISYKDWFIDLTLAQFKKEAPRLSITKRNESCSLGSYRNYREYTAKEYLEKYLFIERPFLDGIKEMIEKKIEFDGMTINTNPLGGSLEELEKAFDKLKI